MILIKDWTGSKTIINTNNRRSTAGPNDYYATSPLAIPPLLRRVKLSKRIWEPCVGGGHLARALESNGYAVTASDIVDYGYANTHIYDFLSRASPNFESELGKADIVTNPPYKYAKECVMRGYDWLRDDGLMCMLLKLTFLEGIDRYNLFREMPPRDIYIFSKRVNCAKNGYFEGMHSAVAYAWYVWQKGFKGAPEISWIAPDEV